MSWTLVMLTGVVFGIGAVLLVKFGNPGNYGYCAACQLRDIAGALGIHKVATLQYARPEVFGWVLGAFAMSRIRGEFRPRGGSNPGMRFLLGVLMMIGALAFLGCPLRGILRLAGGDLNGLTGLAGFISGIVIGIVFLKGGFNLGRAHNHKGSVGYTGYIAAVASLILLLAMSVQSEYINFSVKGPGAQHAPVIISLVAGLAAGLLAQRTRMCLSGGVRDYLLVKDTYLLKIYGVMFVSAMAANLYFGFFKLGFAAQPLAHSEQIWNFLGLFLTGIAATLAGGCPLRQLILSGEGNTDAMVCVLGMLVGAGISHGINAAGSPTGLALHGQIAVVVGIVIVVMIGRFYQENTMVYGKGA